MPQLWVSLPEVVEYNITDIRYRHRCHHHRHLRAYFRGFLQYAGPFAGIYGRRQQPRIPEHPCADGVSGHCHQAVHVLGAVFHHGAGIHERITFGGAGLRGL